MLYCISTNTVNIHWSIQSTLVSNGAPISQVIVEAFDQGEAITGTFPAPLVRQTNIGNASTVLSAATSIQNDGQVVGSSVIEATVSGDSASAVSLTNDGHLALGTLAHPGSVSFDNGKIFSDGVGRMSFVQRIFANLIQTLTGNDLTLGVETGHRIAFQVNNTNVATINADGSFQMVSGPVEFITGSLRRISSFSGTANTSFANYNHGLGIIPDIVLIQFVGSTAGDSATFSYNPATMTNAIVAITCNDATPRSFVALAIKF